MESGSYRAETSVVRNVTTTRFYTVVRLDFHRVSGATSRLPGFLDGVPYLKRTVRPAGAHAARPAARPARKPETQSQRNTDAIPTALCLPPKAGLHNRRHEPLSNYVRDHARDVR